MCYRVSTRRITTPQCLLLHPGIHHHPPHQNTSPPRPTMHIPPLGTFPHVPTLPLVTPRFTCHVRNAHSGPLTTTEPVTRHARFRTTTGVADARPPRYVPPALRRRQGTPRKPLLPVPNHS